MTPIQKLKIAMIHMNINQLELSKRSEQSQPNLSQKMRRGEFSISEYEKLVKAIGCELEMNIILPDGTRV